MGCGLGEGAETTHSVLSRQHLRCLAGCMELPYNPSTWGSSPTDLRTRQEAGSPTLPPPASSFSGDTPTSSLSYTGGRSPGWRGQEGFLEEGSCFLVVFSTSPGVTRRCPPAEAVKWAWMRLWSLGFLPRAHTAEWPAQQLIARSRQSQNSKAHQPGWLWGPALVPWRGCGPHSWCHGDQRDTALPEPVMRATLQCQGFVLFLPRLVLSRCIPLGLGELITRPKAWWAGATGIPAVRLQQLYHHPCEGDGENGSVVAVPPWSWPGRGSLLGQGSQPLQLPWSHQLSLDK